MNIKPIYPIALLGALVATTAAWASHPSPGQMARVRALAHELEDAAHHVHAAAERSAHHYSRAESDALKKLHRLDDRARHFHREVERYYRDPYHTERDFERLIDAFYEARYAMHYLHAFDHVREDFYQVERLVNRLADYYGGYAYWRGHGGHHRYPGAHGGYYYDRDDRWGTRPGYRRPGWYDDSDSDSDSD